MIKIFLIVAITYFKQGAVYIGLHNVVFLPIFMTTVGRNLMENFTANCSDFRCLFLHSQYSLLIAMDL